MKTIGSLTLLALLLFSTTGFPNHLGSFTKITAPDWTTEDYFGSRLALSADGKTMLLGAPGTLKDEGGWYSAPGAAYFFAKDKAGGWSLTKRVDGNGGGHGYGTWTGDTVALSSSGKTALIGWPYVGGCAGNGSWVETLVHKRGAWTTTGGFTLSNCNDRRESIALSSDGKVALLGRPDDYSRGEVYVFVRKGDRLYPQPAFTRPADCVFQRLRSLIPSIVIT